MASPATNTYPTMKDAPTTNGRRRTWRQNEENMVQWKQKNIKDGFVVVDEAQLSKLIKREPIEQYYKLEPPFATGLYASVRRCQSVEDGQQYAAKFSSRKRYGEDCSAEIYHEIALLSLCGSAPRVIQIHDVFETNQEIILIMEYAPGGDLQTIIDDNLVPYESDVLAFVRQCVEGLEYLHQRKIAHLDIKPQNIVMMGEFPHCQIKLCDLEISRVILDGSEIREILGTPDYVAPEILHYDPITLAADMWSLGVTTYVLLTGFSPFGGETDQETFCNISRGDVDLPEELFEDISKEAIDFIKCLLVKNPKARPTAAQCLKHPWLAKASGAPQKPVPPPAASPSTLRKFLSKSREALFDRVVQQHRNSLRKHTLQNQLINKSRLYESQMSLTARSREKLLQQHERMSPSFSKSIEKIYGLKSLSKSQEVLNLYKNGSLLMSQENLNTVVTEILKSRENLLDKECDSKEKEKKLTRATTADLGVLRHRHRKIRIYSGSSTTSIASDMPEDEEMENKEDDVSSKDTQEAKEVTPEKSNIGSEEEAMSRRGDKNLLEPKEQWSSNDNNKDNNLIVSPNKNGESWLVDGEFQISDDHRADIKIEEENETTEVGLEEPRFTVAQLVTAFNKHQEIVTRTSLEVTMTAQQKEVKIPPVLPYSNQTPFPTGPTALRLFIPDIDLVQNKSKQSARGDSLEPLEESSNSLKRSNLQINDANIVITSAGNNRADIPGYLRSTSQSSDASTLVSTEETTPDSSLEPSIELSESKPPVRPVTLQVNNKRSKSQSPSPVCEVEKTQVRKLSAGSYSSSNEVKKSSEPSRRISTSTSTSRKLSVERSPVPSRRNKADTSPVPIRKVSAGTPASPTPARKNSTGTPEFKIVGLGEKSRKGHGIGYKIEFASPLVSRKFPVRTPGVCAKTTISSELKKQDSLKPRRK